MRRSPPSHATFTKHLTMQAKMRDSVPDLLPQRFRSYETAKGRAAEMAPYTPSPTPPRRRSPRQARGNPSSSDTSGSQAFGHSSSQEYSSTMHASHTGSGSRPAFEFQPKARTAPVTLSKSSSAPSAAPGATGGSEGGSTADLTAFADAAREAAAASARAAAGDMGRTHSEPVQSATMDRSGSSGSGGSMPHVSPQQAAAQRGSKSGHHSSGNHHHGAPGQHHSGGRSHHGGRPHSMMGMMPGMLPNGMPLPGMTVPGMPGTRGSGMMPGMGGRSGMPGRPSMPNGAGMHGMDAQMMAMQQSILQNNMMLAGMFHQQRRRAQRRPQSVCQPPQQVRAAAVQLRGAPSVCVDAAPGHVGSVPSRIAVLQVPEPAAAPEPAPAPAPAAAPAAAAALDPQLISMLEQKLNELSSHQSDLLGQITELNSAVASKDAIIEELGRSQRAGADKDKREVAEDRARMLEEMAVLRKQVTGMQGAMEEAAALTAAARPGSDKHGVPLHVAEQESSSASLRCTDSTGTQEDATVPEPTPPPPPPPPPRR